MGRSPCCDQVGVKKGPWTPEEDKKLVDYIQKHGHGSWRNLPRNAGLNRCGKSCRLRWTNYLRPDIKRGKFSDEEEALIIHLHSILGNKWSLISSKLPGRTDNEIKNYWNTHIKKKLLLMGIDPVTHQRRVDLEFFCNLPSLLALPNAGCNHATTWDGAVVRAQLLQGLLQFVLMSSAPPGVDIIHRLFGASLAPPVDMLEVNRQLDEQQWDPTGIWASAAPLQAFHGAQSVAVQRAEEVSQRTLFHSGSNLSAEYDSTPSLVAASPEHKLEEQMSSERFDAWSEMDFGDLGWKDILQ